MPKRGINLNLLAASLACGALLTACQGEMEVRGNLPDQELVEEIQPGVSTRDDVVNLLGSPSAQSTFINDTWFYIGQRRERFAFLTPEVQERQVLEITFRPDDFVAERRVYTLQDGQEVEIVERETPTEGREITVLQQLIGNIGRFPSSTDPPR
jgi:outer membrane protein assembly factor BamE (lipoprotein component of BamABCDE complex)